MLGTALMRRMQRAVTRADFYEPRSAGGLRGTGTVDTRASFR